MKKAIYIFLLAFAVQISAKAQETPAVVEESVEVTKQAGDEAYSQERYQEAIDIYEELLSTGDATLELHYNLGNAYFRNNMIGNAILNYEKALKIDPTDDAAKFNLEFAQNRIKDEIPQADKVLFIEWGESFVNMFSINTWAAIAVSAFIIMLIAALMFIFGKSSTMRRSGLIVAICSLVATVLSNISAYNIYGVMNDNSNAIVMKEEVSVKSSPDSSGTVLIKIHEGRKVKILDDTIKDWVEVEVDNGKLIVGWVPAQTIERI